MKSTTQLDASRRKVSQPETHASCNQRQPGHDARATHRDAMTFREHRRLRPDREGQSQATPRTATQRYFVNLGVLEPMRRPSQRKHCISASTESRHDALIHRSSQALQDDASSSHRIESSQRHASSRRPRNYSQEGNSSSCMPQSLYPSA